MYFWQLHVGCPEWNTCSTWSNHPITSLLIEDGLKQPSSTIKRKHNDSKPQGEYIIHPTCMFSAVLSTVCITLPTARRISDADSAQDVRQKTVRCKFCTDMKKFGGLGKKKTVHFEEVHTMDDSWLKCTYPTQTMIPVSVTPTILYQAPVLLYSYPLHLSYYIKHQSCYTQHHHSPSSLFSFLFLCIHTVEALSIISQIMMHGAQTLMFYMQQDVGRSCAWSYKIWLTLNVAFTQ